MSWSEFLSEMLESTNKVDKAAIFNHKGQPLATTEDLQISEADGQALLNCLKDPAHSLTRITLDGMDFRCFQGNATALVGRAATDKGRVLVARLTDDVLIMVIGNSTGHGSFLYEVQHHLEQRAYRQQVNYAADHGAQEGILQNPQSSLPSAILPPPPVSQSGRGNSVLVQLRD